MSLVGPRPDLPEIWAAAGMRERQVLSLRPGLTGAASLAFRNEEDLLAQSPPERLTHFYLATVSPPKTALDPEYLTFIRQLQSRGVEISLHGVRNAHSGRQQILAGLEEFHRRLGHYPRVHANHSSNRENIYWGAARFTFLGPLYAAMVRPRG